MFNLKPIIITKEDIQKRILKDGKPLELDQFEFNSEMKSFSTKIDGVTVDLSDKNYWFIKVGSNCSVKAGEMCIINAERNNEIETGRENIFYIYSNNKVKAGPESYIIRKDFNNSIEIPKLEEDEVFIVPKFESNEYTIEKINK